MDLSDALRLLSRTRRLTIAVVVLLSIQLFGNLYEQVVTNVQTYASPEVAAVGELEAGSPLFFYLPWVPLGLAAAVLLAVRLHRLAPADVARRARWSLGWLAVAVVSKAFLISQVNPQLRRDDLALGTVRDLAVVWGIANGIAVVAVALALVGLTAWRPRLLTAATEGAAARRPAVA